MKTHKTVTDSEYSSISQGQIQGTAWGWCNPTGICRCSRQTDLSASALRLWVKMQAKLTLR